VQLFEIREELNELRKEKMQQLMDKSGAGRSKVDILARLSDLREMLREIEGAKFPPSLRGRDLFDSIKKECFMLVGDILVYR
jgi:hypothetical protein